MKTLPRLIAVASLAVMTVSGCESATDLDNIFGRYDLQSIGSQDLPHTYGKIGELITVTAGYIELETGNTCVAGFTISDPETAPPQLDLRTCTFTLLNAAIFVTWSDATAAAGDLSNNGLRLSIDLRDYYFTR